MRARSVAPRVISGTIGLMGTAQKMIRTVTETGRDLLSPPPREGTRTDGSEGTEQ
jgi:hypothetical protein